MENYFVIHGSYGNPYKNFIPWLKKELGKRRLNCIVPSFPTPKKQDYESWSRILNAYVEIGYITENTTIITHSLGGIFIVKFLLLNHLKIKKLITIAAFNNLTFEDDEHLYHSFYIQDEGSLKELKKYCLRRIGFYSSNDPYVPKIKAEDFLEKIDSEKVLIENAGHFNEKSGYLEFRELLKYLI